VGAVLLLLAAGMISGAVASRLETAPRPHVWPPGAPARERAAPAASPAPWWAPLPAAAGPFTPVELVVERLRVRAPVEVKGVDAHRTMEAPDRADDAAWYPFTARPGASGNAVFSGHRDFGRVGDQAIFWNLDRLQPGDLVDVVSAERTELRYRVSRTWDYPVADIPMSQVLGTDASQELTLITCSGSFHHGAGYDRRLVVRAVRVP